MVSFALEKLVSLVSFHLLVVVQSLGGVWLFVTPWTAACQASLSFTISKSLLKLMSSPWCHSTISSLLPPSPPAFNLFQHQGLFQWVGSSYQVAKVWELQHQSLQWIFRTDFLKEWLVWSPCSPRDSQESSLTPKALIFWHSAFFRFQLFMKFVYLFEFILGCKVVEMRRPERKTETQRVAEEGIWV